MQLSFLTTPIKGRTLVKPASNPPPQSRYNLRLGALAQSQERVNNNYIIGVLLPFRYTLLTCSIEIKPQVEQFLVFNKPTYFEIIL